MSDSPQVILTGIGTGMVACLCTSAPRKHEFVLYCTVSVLILNALNLIFLEFGQLKHLFGEHVHSRLGREFDVLDTATGRLITTGTAVLLVVVTFIEAQLNFYLLHRCQRARTKRRRAERKNRQLYGSGNDQSADLEYVIPKVNKSDIIRVQFIYHTDSIDSFLQKPEQYSAKSNAHDDDDDDVTDHHHHSQAGKSVQVHNKSWVFEATGDEDDDANYDESSVSLCSSVSPSHSAAVSNGGHQHYQQQQQQQHYQQPHHNQPQQQQQQQHQTAAVVGTANGTPAHPQRQRRISRCSDAASERFAMPLTSFSRCATPSPVPRSGQHTPTQGTPAAGTSSLFSPQYSDYLDTKPASTTTGVNNRLTVDFLAAATAKLKPVADRQLRSADPSTVAVNHYNNTTSNSVSTTGAHPDDSPYASLLTELEHSLSEKKGANGANGGGGVHSSNFSPDNTSLSTSDNKFSSKSASSSKDMEFTKELEAALQLIQELETPSEGPYLVDAQLQQHLQQSGPGASADAALLAACLGGRMARSDSEKTLSAAVSLPSPDAGPLIDTSSAEAASDMNTGGVVLPTSASMHKLVIDVRADPLMSPAAVTTTTRTTPPTTTDAVGARMAPPTLETTSRHGKHVFSVFCNESAGSQSTSGYSSPSTSSQLTHSVRDSCETTASSSTTTAMLQQQHHQLQQRISGTSDRTLNSFGGSNIIRIEASSNRMSPVISTDTVKRTPDTRREPTKGRTAAIGNGHHRQHLLRQHHQPAPPPSITTMFIDTLNADHRRDRTLSSTSSTSMCSSEFENPVRMCASPASRSQLTMAPTTSAATTATTTTSMLPAASKSFLLFKKRSKLMPQPDFQSRIFKSECLAYLTEEELVQRHQLNRNVIRVNGHWTLTK